MAQPVWIKTIRHVIRKHKLPTRQQQAPWYAMRKFDQIVRTLGPEDLVIDCGANVGKVSHILARTGAQVYAFEPDPYCYGILKKSFGTLGNVTLCNKAVGVTNETIRFYRAKDFDADPEKRSLSSSVYGSKLNVDSAQAILVDQIDFISFIQDLPHQVSLLKIDVEGAEVPIIERLLDTKVIDKIRHAFVETHERGIPELTIRTQALRQRIQAEGRDNINLDWR